MTAGRLRHRVDLLRPDKIKDGKGGWESSFGVVATGVRACVEPLDGREALIERVLEGVSTFRITMRWRGDVAAKWQVRFGTMDLNITAPPTNPDGRREWLVIIASSAGALKAG
nr:head-tail adaptor protein [Sphingomonas tagetis]